MGKVLDTVTGAGAAKEGAKKSAKMAQWQDFNANTAFGSGSLSRTGGLNYGGAPGASLTGMFQNLGSQFGAQAGAAPTGAINLDPNAVIGHGMNTGTGVRNMFASAGSPFLSGAQTWANSLNSFNPDEFAQQQYDRLTNLSRPGEESQTRSMLNSLFSKGRLGAGDTTGSRLLGELDKSQLMAADNRALQSIGLAQQEAGSRAGIAGQLAGTGSNLFGTGEQLATSELGRFLASLSGGTQLGGFQDQLSNSLLQRALGATGGISSALAPTQTGLQAMLAAGGLVNNANAGAAAMLSGGYNAAAGAQGQMVGSALGALGTAYGG